MEPNKDWSINTLKEHICAVMKERDDRYEERFEAQEQATASALQGAERAQDLARNAMEKRLDAMNEFRAALTDQTRNFLTKNEYSLQHKALEDIIEAHILNEAERVQAQEERISGRLKGIKEDIEKKADEKDLQNVKDKQEGNNKWLLGMVAAVVVALILTSVDLIVRLIGGS